MVATYELLWRKRGNTRVSYIIHLRSKNAHSAKSHMQETLKCSQLVHYSGAENWAETNSQSDQAAAPFSPAAKQAVCVWRKEVDGQEEEYLPSINSEVRWRQSCKASDIVEPYITASPQQCQSRNTKLRSSDPCPTFNMQWLSFPHILASVLSMKTQSCCFNVS